MVTDILKPLFRHRFGLLLFLQVALLLAAAFSQGSYFREEIFLMALLGVLAGGGINILKGTSHIRPFLATAGLTLAANLYGYYSIEIAADFVASAANLIFMGWVALAMAAHLFGGRRVDENVIIGSACLYIHIGMMFGFVYLLVDFAIPHAFTMSIPKESATEIGRFLEDYLYYSFVTLTTMGYGDIVPAVAAARYLAVIEAITGQLYLAIVVARLVGMHLSHPKKDV